MAKKDWMIKESDLDDDQIKVLMATLDRSCVVEGCAGSGKSVLALIKAKRIQREKGNNYQIIVFTKALCNYMNAGRKELGLTKEFRYHWQWKNRLGCPSSDYVIVDEIQDFDEDEIEDFIDATNKNYFFFGDTAQSIYEGLKDTMPVGEIGGKHFELYRNYRLPKPVAYVVQKIGVDLDGFDIDTYKSKETAMPRFIQYSDFNSQMDAIARLIKNGNISDVGILLLRNEDVKRVSDALNNLDIHHELKCDDRGRKIYNLDFTTENPKIMTYHSAKGLQFGTVILPCIQPLDPQKRKSQQKALYVAMTRTYRNLYVMYSGNLPYPLSRVPEELYETTEINGVEDI